jgi:ABC-type branched-subunit amino acid transport system permease subunit
MSSTLERSPALDAIRVTRSSRPRRWTLVLGVAVVALLAYLPYLAYAGTTDTLTDFFVLLTMSSMWNLLAGYAGMVSVGQQAFIGLGAYFVLILAQHGVEPFVAIPIATVGCAVIAIPIALLLLRLRGGYFAIATWVVAEVCLQVISRFKSLGGGTGAPLPGIQMDPTIRTAITYWASLAVAVGALAAIYLLLRGRVGLVLTAIRDNEIGARSLGVRVARARRVVFLVAAAGCGAAGTIVIISALNVQAPAAFTVEWSANMIFVTIIGGIGTIEGPIVGSIVFFALQQSLSQHGALYLIIVGLVAIVVAIWAPRGLWGLIGGRLRLFPVGYWLRVGSDDGRTLRSSDDPAGTAAAGGDASVAARVRDGEEEKGGRDGG